MCPSHSASASTPTSRMLLGIGVPSKYVTLPVGLSEASLP